MIATVARRKLLVAACVSLLASGCRSVAKRDTIDLGPGSGWRARGAVTVRADGRISLAADGRGSVVKTVTLDVDQYPAMLVRTGQSLPRLTWIVSASPVGDTTHQFRLIEKHAEEGGYVVPLRATTRWRGKVRFDLSITLEGRRGDWIEFGDLEAVRLTDRQPPAPRLELPANGAVLSPGALHYEWFQSPNAVAYELQVSGSPAVAGAATRPVAPPYLADKLPYLPTDNEQLRPGTWWWRVRALNVTGRPGPWSATNAFTIRLAVPRRPRELEISSVHPLILLLADGRRLAQQWRVVPAALKPYVVFRLEALPSESLEAAVAVAQREGIPIAVQASGPHDYYGPTSSRIPLSEIERIFERFPVVKGVYICEQSFRVAPTTNRIMMDYARRLVPLAAEHGKVVLWADAHWGRNLWLDVGLNRALMDTIRAYPQYLVPIQKMNGALTPYTAHDAVFGLWVSGAVENWGVQPERWYWYEAGLGKQGSYGWFKEGETAAFPPAFYGQMALLGLSGGATVYSIEPGDDTWGADSQLSEVARSVVFPLLWEIASRRLIPTREQVGREIRSVYLADSADAPWSLDYGTMRALYRGSYGVAHPFDLIPVTGRYYWIPILPRWTPSGVLARFPDRLRAGAPADSVAARRHLDARFPAAGRGNAWVVRVGALTLVQNSDANGGTSQEFDLSLSGVPSRIAGRVGPNGYLVFEREADGLRVHANGRPGTAESWTMAAPERPSRVVVTPPDAAVLWRWEPRGRRAVIEMRSEGRAVVVEIGFGRASR